MKIRQTNPIFKANYYNFTKNGSYLRMNQIKTDNEENLGNKPILVSDKFQIPMFKDGNFYTADLQDDLENYRIYYQDTDKYENGGQTKHIDYTKLGHLSFIAEKLHNKLPLEQSIVEGEAQGKLVKVKTLNEIKKKLKENSELQNESLVLLVEDEKDYLYFPPENVRGIIFRNGNLGHLSHEANIFRMYTDMVSTVHDDKVIEKLKKYKDKYIDISNQDGKLTFAQILQSSHKARACSKIIVPEIDSTDKILNYHECTKKNCGNKAYRLSLLSKLAKVGFLSDVNIPKGFVLPSGYINNLHNYFLGNNKRNYMEMYDDNKFLDEISSKLKDKNINSDYIIVRSAFNGEDLEGFSAAGLYDSCITTVDEVVPTINHVAESKNSKRACAVRAMHQIPDSAILPSIIIQEYIPADYAFTVYTDTGNNKMLIEVRENHDYQEAAPAFITFDKSNNTLEYSAKVCLASSYLVDDNYKIMKQNFKESSLTINFEKLRPILKNLVQNAQKLENMFAKPQDIEGGIKDGKLFLWQVRDIVKHA